MLSLLSRRDLHNNEDIMNNYELDPTVPYFGSDVDLRALHAKHALLGDPRDELLDRLGLYCDEVLALEPVAMRGIFRDGIFNDHTFHWTFTPGEGDVCAIVMPVVKDGCMIDLVACGDYERGWGCVTGHGEIAGPLETTTPLRVYKSAWRWLQWSCNGVLPLAKSALPQLASAPLLIAEDLDHADYLAYQTFVRPKWLGGRPEEEIRAAELEAPSKVGVDPDLRDIEKEIFLRARAESIGQLKTEGVWQ